MDANERLQTWLWTWVLVPLSLLSLSPLFLLLATGFVAVGHEYPRSFFQGKPALPSFDHLFCFFASSLSFEPGVRERERREMVVSSVKALGKVIDDRSGGGLRIGGLVPLFNWQAVKLWDFGCNSTGLLGSPQAEKGKKYIKMTAHKTQASRPGSRRSTRAPLLFPSTPIFLSIPFQGDYSSYRHPPSE